MISGIVYFDEIVANVKDRTGITNLMSSYPKIRRSIINAENDIGAGGLVVRKIESYTLNDGRYDGQYLIIPEDFVGEYDYYKQNVFKYLGDRIELYDVPGPETVDLIYIGMLTDQYGNPITTRNHFEAVVTRAVLDLYRPKIFLGVGNFNVMKDMETTYYDQVMASRGNDAFPTEAEWAKIGETLNMNMSRFLTPCGEVMVDPFSTRTINADGTCEDCGDLTVDLVQIYNTAKTT